MNTVPGEGPQTATWAVIGEAPGYHEDKQGRPFVGPSGQLLRQTLKRVGLDPTTGYVTNVVKVRPPGNATPTTAEIKQALPALAEELRALPNLRLVLLVGSVPASAVAGLAGGITKNRGVTPSVRPDFQYLEDKTVFVTVHPAFVLRNQSKQYNGFLQDLAAFAQLVHPPEDVDEIVLIDSVETWKKLEDALKKAITGAIDIETTVEDDPKLVSVALTVDGVTAYVIPYHHPETPEVPVDTTFVKRRLEAIEWTMHNGYFDRMMMRRFGLNLKLKHDTMAMAYLLHEEERKGLEVLSSVYLGEPPYKGVDYKNILDEPLEKIARMNGKDALRTYRLFRPLADELNKNPDLSRIYQWLLLPAVNALIEVTENGVPVDRQRLEELTRVKEAERVTLLTRLQEATPAPSESKYPKGWPKHKEPEKNKQFNPGSAAQVRHVLFDHFGLPVLKLTDKGKPSTDEETLTLLAIDAKGEAADYMERLLQYRRVDKALNSYLYAWPKLMDDAGYLHPRYKPLHVVTGRLSSELPNIQQVPRDKAFRNVFGGVEDHVWLKGDFSQIELRIAAELSGESMMLAAFQKGEDLHSLTAKLLLGIEDPKAEYRPGLSARDLGKIMNFGLLYGAGWRTLIRQARTDYGIILGEGEAKNGRERYFMAYPYLLDWHHRLESEIRNTGRSVSPLGRIRHLPDATLAGRDDESRKKSGAAVREGINHPVQSFASDMLLMSLVRLRGKLPPGVKIIAEVHDELDLLVPRAVVQETKQIVQATMEDLSWLGPFGVELEVPIVAEVGIGEYWGALD